MTNDEIRAVDAYFASVRKILAEAPAPLSCCVPPVDSATVEIDVSLDAKTYEFTLGTSGADRLVTSENPSFDERRVASIMERTLKLSQQLSRNASPDK